MPSLAKALHRCVFHGVMGEVQLLPDGAVGRAFDNQTDNHKFGVGAAVQPIRVVARQKFSFKKNITGERNGASPERSTEPASAVMRSARPRQGSLS